MIAIDNTGSNDPYLNADLHCHSSCSDGVLSPSELASRGAERGVEMMALTDHDTTAGLDEFAAALPDPVRFIPGIEFSTVWNGAAIHIVGLNFRIADMQDAVHQQEKTREIRAVKIAERLAAKGFPGAWEGAGAISGHGLPGRLHFAKWMVSQGLCRNQSEAFKKWLGAGKAGDVKAMWPDIETAVDWIRQAGGVAVLAHPLKYRFTRRKLGLLVDYFCECGGQAIETAVSGANLQQSQMIGKLAQEKQLAGSRGSDFHSPDTPWCELGRIPAVSRELTPVWQLFS